MLLFCCFLSILCNDPCFCYKLLLYINVLPQLLACVMWCLAREEEKSKVKKQNEALTAERKHLEQRAVQLAESLAVSDHLLMLL